MKKILLTGKNSYIGNSFKTWLLSFPEKYTIETISLRDNGWRQKDFSSYDVVLNVAGIAHIDTRPEMEEQYYKINRDLCIEVATKAKRDGVSQFVFLSSMIVYSNLTPVITRDTIPNPLNFYGKSKVEADIAIQTLNCDTFKVASIRPPMVYGPNCKGNFQKLYDFALHSPIFPDIENQRSMIFINNLCEFIRLVIDHEDHGIFYPQNKEYVNVAKVVKLIANLHGKQIQFIKIFNPLIKLFLGKNNILNKIFGTYRYEQDMSNHYNWEYCKTDISTSIQFMRDYEQEIAKSNIN